MSRADEDRADVPICRITSLLFFRAFTHFLPQVHLFPDEGRHGVPLWHELFWSSNRYL